MLDVNLPQIMKYLEPNMGDLFSGQEHGLQNLMDPTIQH